MNEELIRNEIQRGLSQVDSSFVITSFNVSSEKDRSCKITFTASNSSGATITSTNHYE